MTNSYGQLARSLEAKRLIVFGAGGYLREFAYRYQELLNKIDCILDNKYQEEGTINLADIAIRVASPRMVVEYDVSKYVVLFCSRYAMEMKEQLDGYVKEAYEFYVYPLLTLDMPMGDKNLIARVVEPSMEIISGHGLLDEVLRLTGCTSEEMFRQKLMNRELVQIPRLVVVLTERCTLRCKECDNLMRHFKSPKELNDDVIKDSLRKIIDAVDVLSCCELIGGEPFLANSLGRVINFLLNEEKVMRIEITSNGTILPKQEDIPLLCNDKVTVRLSDYRNIVDQSRFIDCMKENGIKLESMPKGMWLANGSVEQRGRSADKLLQQYDRCSSGKICKTLWEDVLFVCARAASLAALGCIGKEQAIKVSESVNLREEIIRFMCNPLVNACGYCDNESGEEQMVEAAEQVR